MKKPIYKKWWFWVIIGVVALFIIGLVAEEPDTPDGTSATAGSESVTEKQPITSQSYQKVDLQTMLDELEENALRAESKYQNTYVEVTGKIAGFDSDGAYITIEPVYADEWNFDTVMCYIKSDAQRDFVIEKSVGDTVTIKGKIISIGELLGYSLNIDSIS